MGQTIGLTVKGELYEQYSCKVDLSRSLSISGRGGFILFSHYTCGNLRYTYDYKNRVVRIDFGDNSNVEYFEFSYFGDYIANIVYRYCSLSPEYFSFTYNNGRIAQANGPNGNFKIVYDSYNDVVRGERL
jgi:hypothetical protein